LLDGAYVAPGGFQTILDSLQDGVLLSTTKLAKRAGLTPRALRMAAPKYPEYAVKKGMLWVWSNKNTNAEWRRQHETGEE